ncbi:MAG TPA: C25 family cysteine peptidase, partial [Candidatus Thermoplasmatota archaeon]|nr:C25 family cysteine peptidase [Candidatus Thermoplasmatota archaeon]
GVSRDDKNQGSKDWYVPVRYTNLDVGSYDDPGFISDLYYADLYKEEGVFEDWDSNDNGIFSEWTSIRKDEMDLSPDVYVGRLACRNENEVTTMVNKIINYENGGVTDSWFNRIVAVAGDAFQDQEDLNILWDTKEIDEGTYTIHAQSTNPDSTIGPVDEVSVTIDRSQESVVSFSEDDHLKTDTYPFSPIAEITSPSEGNILGTTDVSFTPDEAYSGYYWANVNFVDGVMHIRGKSYDPQPYGYQSSIAVWITNSDDEIIFEAWRNNTKNYYEDEWSTGDRIVGDRGGSLYYMPENFEKEYLWTSNGNWNDQSDVIETFSQGSGFVHFSGHASPRTWGDQYPGIPGGRRHASVTGLVTFNPFGMPMFPMSKLSNGEKLPVVVACGCHNGQFNVTLLSTLLQKPFMWTYGVPIPECWSWWLTRLEQGGSIATISNTGMGYGMQGEQCIAGGLNPWLDTEFFRLYGQEGKDMLGAAYEHAIGNYLGVFEMNDPVDGIGHVKSVQQWTLLGDPSLKIGGYS